MKKLMINIILFYIFINYSAYSQVALWAEKIGGIDNDYISNSYIDSNQNIFIIGRFFSDTLHFNNDISLYRTTSMSMFIAKYNNAGLCQWASGISGNSIYNSISKISIDNFGHLYICGTFVNSLIFNNGISLSSNSQEDGFLAKYNSSGLCQWAEKISGNSKDYVNSLSISKSGLIYICGRFNSSILNFNNGKSTNNVSYDDCFIAIYQNDGKCQAVGRIVGNNQDQIIDIELDNNDNFYLTGITSSDSLVFNNNINLYLESAGSDNIFLAKYDSSNKCLWAEKITGEGTDYSKKICLDNLNNIYIAGFFYSNNLYFNNGKSLKNSGINDGFIAKYNNNGICQWVEKIGGESGDDVYGIEIDKKNNLFVYGHYSSLQLIFNNNNKISKIDQQTSNPDAFITKYNENGICQWTENIYGDRGDYIYGLSINNFNKLIIAGIFSSNKINFGDGISLNNTLGSKLDGFLAKYDVNPLPKPNLYTPPNNSTNYTINPTFKWEGNIIAENYQLQIATDSLFTSLKKNFSDLSDTSISISEGASLDNDTKYYWRVRSYNGTDTSNWSDVWNFTTKPISPVPDSWAFIDYTGSNSTVIIPAGVKPSINFRTLKVGDAIGFFYNRDDSLICAGYEIWTDENLAITVWGDDSQTNDKDGYEINESYIIKLWDALDGKEYDAEYQVSSGEKFFTDNGITVISSLKNRTTITQNTYLKTGWNTISTYVTPTNDSLEVIWQILQDKLLIQKNNAGQVFIPSFGINTIGKWNLDNGYKVYMSSSDTLKITGMLIETQKKTIILNAGWSIVSYLRNSAKDISECVTSLTDRSTLLIAKNNDGLVYIPSFDINTIGNMLPGQGYQMYISAKDTLVYPANGAGRTAPSDLTPMPKYILPEFKNTGNSAILLLEIEGNNGDEVAVYNQNNQVIGSGVIHNNKAAITIWGDNDQTNAIDGAVFNYELRIMNYELNSGRMKEVKINDLVDVVTGNKTNDLKYLKDAFFVAKAKVLDNNSSLSMQVNPNPASDYIEITIEGESDNTSLILFNNEGKQLTDLTSELLTLSGNKLKYNTTNFSSGTYNLILNNGNDKIMKQIMIVK